jgi:hypothetical protein
MRRLASFLFGAYLVESALFWGKCAIAGDNEAKNKTVGADYEYLDSRGDYRLIEKNKDVYIEKLDGSEGRQITHTPDIEESGAQFSKDGKYIIFTVRADPKEAYSFKCYLIKRDSDDSTRKEISRVEALNLIYGE